MKRQLLSVLAAVGVMGAMLSGCGGSSSTSQSSSETQAKEVQITFGWWGAENRHAYTEQLVNSYMEKNPDVKFQLQPNAWDGYWEKMTTQAAGGGMPTILQMDYAYLNTYASNETLYDLSAFVEDGTLQLDGIDEKLLEKGKYDGKLVAVPMSQSTRTMIVNTKALEDAGLAVPDNNWTWEEYEQLCIDFTEKTGNYAIDGYSNAFMMMQAMLLQDNIQLYSEDGKSLGFDSYEAILPFFEHWDRMAKAGAIYSPDENVTYQQLPSNQTLLATNQSAFNYGANTYPMWTENEALKLMTIPYSETGEKGNWAQPGMFFCIAATATEEQAREAAEFINWWLNDTEVADVAGTERGVPASSEMREHLEAKSDSSVLEKDALSYFNVLAEHGTECPAPSPNGAYEVGDEHTRIFENMLSGKVTPEQAAQEFFEKANEILARNNV